MLFTHTVSMIGAEHRGTGRRSQPLAQLERDAALQRVSRTRRWLILTAGAMSAAFAALVSAIAPGHSLSAKAQASTLAAGSTGTAKTTPTTPRTTKMPPLASPGALGLQGPSQDPQASSDPSQAASDPSQAQSQPVQPDPSQSPAAVQNPAAAAPSPAPAAVSGGS
jgi:hypothetical protein